MPRQSGAPPLNEFLAEARPLNPGWSDADITREYVQSYGVPDNIGPLPSFEEFLPEAAAVNPGWSDADIHQEWQERYGVFGAHEKSSGLLRRAADIPVGITKGIVDLPKIAVGLADIPTGGAAGRATQSVLDVMGAEADRLGLPAWARPSQWSAELNKLYSPETQAARQGAAEAARESVETAKREGAGALGQIAASATGAIKGIAKHPASIVPLVAENLAPMGVIAKGTALALKPLAAILDSQVAAGTMTALEANAQLGQAAIKYASAGEGIMAAGQVSSQISAEAPAADIRHRMAAVIAGVTTAAITRGAAKIPGLGDVEATMAVSALGREAGLAGTLPQRIAKGILAEGLLQELPQSTQEQIWQNIATGKPWHEGIGEQAVQGFIAGGILGGSGAAVYGPSVVSKPLPLPTPAPPPKEEEPADILDQRKSLDESIASAQRIVESPAVADQLLQAALGRERAAAEPVLRGEQLPTQAQVELVPRGTPIHPAPPSTGLLRSARDVAQERLRQAEPEVGRPLPRAGQPITTLEGAPAAPAPSGIEVVTPPRLKAEAEPDAREQIARERQRLVEMRERARLEREGQALIMAPAQAAPVTVERPTGEVPLPSRLELAYPSVEKIHKLAEAKGIQWDQNPAFMAMTKMVTGQTHLDDLRPMQRQRLYNFMNKLDTKTGLPEDVARPKEPLIPFDAATIPRQDMAPRQNAELLARAEKAQADMEIAGSERGGKNFDYDVEGQGGTPRVTAWGSATADWYKDATTGPGALSRERVEKAIAKIIADHGLDVGKDVQRIKQLLLEDREFEASTFMPQSEEEWADLVKVATEGRTVEAPKADAPPANVEIQNALDEASHEAATSPTNALPAASSSPSSGVSREEAERLFDEAQALMRTLPNNIGKAKQEGRLSAKQLEALARLDEIEKILPNTSPEWRRIYDERRAESDARHGQNIEKFRAEQIERLREAGFALGNDVQFFAPSMLGPFGGGQMYRGKIIQTPNGSIRVRDKRGKTYDFFKNPWRKAPASDVRTSRPTEETKPDQQEIPVPPPTIGRRPLIGREPTKEEAPLFSQEAQTPEPEQAELPTEAPEPRQPRALVEAARRPAPEEPWGLQRDDLAPNDEVEWKSPFTGDVTRASYRGDQNGQAMLWTGRTQVLANYRDLRRPEVATPVAPTETPQAILANALRTAADQIEGKPAPIVDVGEKVGGARKDLAEKTGPKAVAPKATDEVPGWRKRYEVSQIVKSARGDEGKWTILDTRQKDFAGRPSRIGGLFDSKEEAEAMIPMVAVSRNHRAYWNREGQWEIHRIIGDRKSVKVVDQVFDTEDAAKRYLATHAEEIIETKTNFGEEILPRPETVQRIGPERREGRNVTADDFQQAFDFRAVEFGNWTNQDERQEVMNHAYDGLLDLAETLGIPPKAIGLNGELALAFGARGHGLIGAAAHYERNYGVINLTKMKGAGRLAHEWFHATDHYFGRQDTKAKGEKIKNERGDLVYSTSTVEGDYVSHGFSKTASGVRQEVQEAYKAMIQTMLTKGEQYVEDAQKVERFVAEARDDMTKALDAMRNTDYLALSKQVPPDYRKRNLAPATADQLAEFDGIAERMLRGEFLETQYQVGAGKSRRSLASGRWTNEALEKISAIYKAARGRSGFGSGYIRGPLDDLRGRMRRYSERLKMLAEAQSGTEKTKQLPTAFAMEAKSIDQGRQEAYWMTNHEMAARAFEAYVEDRLKEQRRQSDFLVYGTHHAVPTPWGWRRPYPTGEERQAINVAFDHLFVVIDTKETGQGLALYNKSLSEPVPTFFSQAERVLTQKMPNRASGEQVRGILSPANGVKPDEVKWIGLDDYLKTKDYFTKQEVLDFVKENQVQVREVMLVGGKQIDEDAFSRRHGLEMERLHDLGWLMTFDPAVTEGGNTQIGFTPVDENNEVIDHDPRYPEYVGTRTSEERALALKLWNAAKDESQGATKFGQYQIPGGTNYRELLLTLPLQTETRTFEQWWEDSHIGAFEPESELGKKLARDEYNAYVKAGTMTRATSANFTGGHFSEPNVLAHVRFNDRTTADGKKSLLIEEVQSDWAARGRKEGFALSPKEVGKIRNVWDAFRLSLSETGKDRRVPSAPFVGKTEGWVGVAMKRMLRYAAEHGYDSLAWTTGAQQSDRYDLSKQVDRIDYFKRSDGMFDLEVRKIGEENMLPIASAVPQEKLADYIGKDLADRMSNDEGAMRRRRKGWKGFSDLDLKIGGEGMNAFYDEIIPAFLNKYGKKWGARVETIDLGGVNMDAVPKFDKDTGKDISPTVEVHALPITDAMRRSVLTEGQALFNQTVFHDPSQEEATTVQAAIEDKSALEAAEWLAQSAPSEDYRLIASRVADRLREFQSLGMRFTLRVTHIGERVPVALIGTRGMTYRADGSTATDLYIQGADVTGYIGTSYETVLHELLHAVTQTALHVGNRRVAEGTAIAKSAKELTDVANAVIEHYNDRVRAANGNLDALTPFERTLYRRQSNALWNTDEVLTWALTNREMQQYLEAIPYRRTTLWGRFVEAVRSVLGLSVDAETALSEVLRIGDELLSTPVNQLLAMAKTIGLPTTINERGLMNAQVSGSEIPQLDLALEAPEQEVIQAIRGTQQRLPLSRQPDRIAYQIPESTSMDNTIRLLQDKNIDLVRLVEAIQKTGKDVADDLNPVLKEEMYMGRVSQRLKDFLTDELEPLVKEMRKTGVTMEQIDRYLHARHAREANAYLKTINEDREDHDALSGMTDREADRILAEADKKVMEPLAQRVDAILAKTRQNLVDYGLESQATINQWQKQYAHYVPLHREGFEDEEALGTGMGRSVRGPQAKPRLGSTRGVVNILANVARDREKALVRGEKMRPVIALAGLLIENPNRSIARLAKPAVITYTDPDTGLESQAISRVGDYQVPMIRFVNRRTGQVESRPDPTYKGRDNVVNFRLQGKDYAIIFNEENERAMHMARALKDLDVGQLNSIMQAVAPITRYLASINTQYNPIFGLVNFVRDSQFAMLTLQSTPLAGKRKEVWQNAWKALRGIYADARAIRDRRHATSEVAQLWERFQETGGQTGYRDLFRTSNDRAKAIEHLLDQDWWKQTLGGKILTAGGLLSQAESAILNKAAKPLFEWLSDYNLTMENAVRLGVFKTGIDAGLSDEQAASLAKNITVNFNKKGQISAQIGSIFAFFNASVQGTARMAETLFESGQFGVLSQVGKRILVGGVTLGALQTFALTMAGFGDDEPPEWLKARSLVIPVPGTEKGYMSIPMPLGFNLIPSIGRLAAESLVFGRPIERGYRFFGALIDAFSPVGSSASVLQMAAPTVVDPFVALVENKDWTGRRIAKEDFSKLQPTPGHTRIIGTATPWARGLAEAINYATLGSAYSPGLFSPTPDQIDYLISQATGGIGREVSKTVSDISALTTGEDVPLYKVPLLGRFAGTASDMAAEREQFYRHVRELNMLEAEIKGRRANREDVRGFIQEHPEARLAEMAGLAEREVQALNRRKRDLIKRGAEREQIRRIEERIWERMRRLNQRVKQVVH